MAWTYASKEVVAALQHLSIEELEDEWSDWAEALIAEHYGYGTIGTTATVTDEKHSGDGTPYLYVKYPPIVSVTSLEFGTTTTNAITSTSYKVFDDHIELINDPKTNLAMAYDGPGNVFTVGTQNITITYVSGVASVPAIVQFCAAMMIAEIARYYKRGGADNSIKFAPQGRTEGQIRGVVADKGLAATLRSHMDNLLRKRVIPLG